MLVPPTEHWGQFLVFTGEMGLLSVGAAWVIIFVVRLVGAPVRVYAALQATIPPERKSDIEIALNDGAAFESPRTDAEGNELPATMVFHARVTNTGEKFLEKCQVAIGREGAVPYPVSGLFDLRSEEPKNVAIVHLDNNRGPGNRAFIYMLQPNDQKIMANGPSLLLSPGEYDVRVFSAGSAPAVLRVNLEADFDKGRPHNWRMSACN